MERVCSPKILHSKLGFYLNAKFFSVMLTLIKKKKKSAERKNLQGIVEFYITFT